MVAGFMIYDESSGIGDTPSGINNNNNKQKKKFIFAFDFFFAIRTL